jgi:glycosyltransferase involved in cell wall biosynthesis
MGSLFQPTTAPELSPQAAPSTSRDTGGPLRILLITDTDLALRGGSERFLTHLLEGLDTTQFQIDLIQLDRAPDSTPDSALRLPPGRRPVIEHRPVGAVYRPRAWKVWWELRARIRQGRYDIIQSQHEKSDLLNAFLPKGPGYPLKISNRRDTGFQKGAALRTLFVLINHRFDRFIAPSRAILEQLSHREGVDASRTCCLPNGVDCERYRPLDDAARRSGRQHHGFAASSFLIGCVARLVPVKRHADLIEGFARVAGRHPDAQLVLVGGGPLESSLKHHARRLGIEERIRFFGEGRRMEQLLPLFDAFALASRTEGLSNAILEAMACGLPVVATRVGGNPELVQEDLSGFLVAPCRPDEMAASLSRLLEDHELGRSMGRAARARVEAAFSLPAMIASFTAYYHAQSAALKT